MFNLNNYIGKYVMHCKNEREAESFCLYLHKQGKTWKTGACYIPCYSDNTEVQTGTICYNFNAGTHDEIDFYRKNNYTILEWSDFMGKEFTKFMDKKFSKEDLKTGMIVEIDNNFYYLVLRNTRFGDILKQVDVNGFRLPWRSLDDFSNDLKYYSTQITRIYSPCSELLIGMPPSENSLIWTRNNTTELTIKEIEERLGIKNLKIAKENND